MCARDATVLAESLARTEELLKLVELTDDILVVSNGAAEILYANPAAVRLHGDVVLSPEARLTDFLWGPEDLESLMKLNEARTNADHRASTRLIARGWDDSKVDMWVSTVYDPTNELWYTVERDITENVLAENRLRQLNIGLEEMANRDVLTGLANRARLSAQLEDAALGQDPIAILMIDLDNFKEVNDTLGHQQGDELLCQTADRLRRCVGERDMIARFGGDEFVILLRSPESVASAVEHGHRVLATLAEPFKLEDRTIHTAASIGVAFSSERSNSADELLRDADLAMYRAKHEGRNRVTVFDQVLVDEIETKVRTTDELRTALVNDEIDVALQGIFCAEMSELVGYEALLRWIHPTRGFIPPDAFVELAEEEGLLDALTGIVLKKSLDELHEWLAEDGHTLSVNFAPSQLLGSDLAGVLEQTLARYDLTPDKLVVEITEVGLTGALAAAAGTLARLQDAGFILAIDDFGKGASSLGYLRDFPIGMVKIDGSFIHRMLEDDYALAITESVVALARRLDLTVVAECVETEAQHELLQEMGCERLQGYLLHRPTLISDHAIGDLVA